MFIQNEDSGSWPPHHNLNRRNEHRRWDKSQCSYGNLSVVSLHWHWKENISVEQKQISAEQSETFITLLHINIISPSFSKFLLLLHVWPMFYKITLLCSFFFFCGGLTATLAAQASSKISSKCGEYLCHIRTETAQVIHRTPSWLICFLMCFLGTCCGKVRQSLKVSVSKQINCLNIYVHAEARKI